MDQNSPILIRLCAVWLYWSQSWFFVQSLYSDSRANSIICGLPKFFYYIHFKLLNSPARKRESYNLSLFYTVRTFKLTFLVSSIGADNLDLYSALCTRKVLAKDQLLYWEFTDNAGRKSAFIIYRLCKAYFNYFLGQGWRLQSLLF